MATYRFLPLTNSIQFAANLDLAKHGYSFIFLDGDVYLTGLQDPFADMLPLSNDTWDIQFQTDGHEPNYELNIGWYFAKATKATVEFFKRSYAKWNETEGWKVEEISWDQKVMSRIGWTMEFEEHSLRIHHLHGPHFKVNGIACLGFRIPAD
jgi:hypothetical protein